VFGDDDEEELADTVTTAEVQTSPTAKSTTTTTSPTTAVSTASPSTSTTTWNVDDAELNDGMDVEPQPVKVLEAFCESVNERQVVWPKTLSGTKVELPCPNNEGGKTCCRQIPYKFTLESFICQMKIKRKTIFV